MAERDSLWVTGAVDQEEARVGTGALWTPSTNNVKALSGLRPGPSNPGAVTASGTPDANVNVAPFQAVLQSTRGTTAGTYVMTLDSSKTVNILSTPAHASLARNDLVIAWQKDTFYGDANSAMAITQVVGTPSGSPADPSLASYPDCIQLARVRVNANATTITNANITDLRPAYTVALGGLLPVANQTARDALTGKYDGMGIYRQDRDWVEVWNGSGWRIDGIPVCSSVSDLSAITGPYAGQVAYISDRATFVGYTGSAWSMGLGQYLGETRITSGDINQGPSHIVLISCTFTAISGMRYEAYFDSAWQFNTGNQAIVSIRHASGSSITTSSTAVCNRSLDVVSTTKAVPLTMSRPFVATASGTYTVGVTSNFYTGANSLFWGASTNNEMYLSVRSA